MSEQPFFSIILPAYNAGSRIKTMLDSIKAQTFTDYELIVICDSCTDNTALIAESYGATLLNVDYHSDGLTRNAGLNIARGQWVLFADDDDWFLHEYVFRQLADVVGKHNEDILFFSFVDRVGGYTKQTPDNMHVAVWNKCWRREYIGNVRFSNRRYSADGDFHNFLMAKPHRFVYWDMPMYYYNSMRPGSMTDLFTSEKHVSGAYKIQPHQILTDSNKRGDTSAR